ncbi:MAG: cell division protein ZapA [Bacteroidetes bacterium]|nr:cell division protein ZapA [Bacteroidota bacterium]
MKQETIRVQILGREYPLRVNNEDVTTIIGVAENVNYRMKAFKEQYPDQPDMVAAVLTALELAEELIGARETSNFLLSAIDRETEYVGRELSEALKHVPAANK